MTNKLVQSLLITIIGVSIGYVGISTWDKYSEAQLYNLSQYFSGIDDAATDTKVLPQCPKLTKVEGVTGAVILKDECTNLYWHNVDLPLEDQAGNREGYTWYEADAFCENLGTAGGRSLFRLPTADELLSLTSIPCVGTTCSPLTDLTATVYEFDDATSEFVQTAYDGATTSNRVVLDGDRKFFYETASGIKFAEGAYWTATELDMNKDLSGSNIVTSHPDGTGDIYEAASSVNLHYGTVNNPVFGKHVRLNARCILDKMSDQEIYELPGNENIFKPKKFFEDSSIKVSELIWWEDKGQDAGNNLSKNLTLALRKNWISLPDPITKEVDVNDCPEGVSTFLTGDVVSRFLGGSFQLCTGVSETTTQKITFGCQNSGESFVKNTDFILELEDLWKFDINQDGTAGDGDSSNDFINNTVSPAICN